MWRYPGDGGGERTGRRSDTARQRHGDDRAVVAGLEIAVLIFFVDDRLGRNAVPAVAAMRAAVTRKNLRRRVE